MASRWVKMMVEEQGVTRLTISAPTLADCRDVFLFGESGLMNAYAPNDPNRPEYLVSKSQIVFPKTGTIGLLVPAESPERGRGHNSEVCIFDEAGSYKNAKEFYDVLMYGLRMGISQSLVTTTPRPNDLIIDLYKRRELDVNLITGSTLENAENLSPQMVEKAKRSMNTRLGQQEIMGKLLLESAGALLTNSDIEKATVYKGQYTPKNWERVVIGVDPAGEGTKSSDEMGIIIAIEMEDGNTVVWEDCTGKYNSKQWSDLIREKFYEYSAIAPTKIVVEKTGLGYFCKDILHRDDKNLPIIDFPATTKKFARAEQVAYLVQTEKVFFNCENDLTKLTEEWVVWDGSGRSPNAIDACVIAVSQLTYKRQNVTMAKEMFF